MAEVSETPLSYWPINGTAVLLYEKVSDEMMLKRRSAMLEDIRGRLAGSLPEGSSLRETIERA